MRPLRATLGLCVACAPDSIRGAFGCAILRSLLRAQSATHRLLVGKKARIGVREIAL